MALRLGAATAQLLAALWSDPGLLAGVHRLDARAVRWNDDAAATQPGPGFTIDAADLSARLAARLRIPLVSGHQGDCDWTIDARRAEPHAQRFGTRTAQVAHAMLRGSEDMGTCRMEAVPDGWLFLLPLGGDAAALQFVTPGSARPVPAVLAGSSLVAASLASAGAWSPPLPAMAGATLPAAAPGRLALGEAALSFDPIAGDGVGHALRGAVLAATTLDEVAKGGPAGPALARYDATLRAAMAHHLGLCVRHYRAATPGAVWDSEIVAMEQGRAALAPALAAQD